MGYQGEAMNQSQLMLVTYKRPRKREMAQIIILNTILSQRQKKMLEVEESVIDGSQPSSVMNGKILKHLIIIIFLRINRS